MERPAIIYARVSSAHQKEKGYSLPTQIAACQKYAEQHGLDVLAVYQDDESGAKSDREGLDKAREVLRTGTAHVLIIYQIDRAFRDSLGYLLLVDDVRKAGAELHIAARGRKTGAASEDRLIDLFESWKAEREREDIRERTARGRRAKAEGGKYIGHGTAPYGYRREGERGDVALVVVEEEARIVVLVFTLYCVGDGEGPLGVREIVKRLNELGVPSPGDGKGYKKERSYGEWNTTAIYDMLSNPTYTGTFYAYRFVREGSKIIERPKSEWVPTAVPAIIGQELFDIAKKRLSEGRARSPRNSRHQYLVGRRVSCTCGYKISGKPSHVRKAGKHTIYLYYRCNGLDPSITAHRCNLPSIPVPRLDALVWDYVVNGLLEDTELEAKLRRKQQNASAEQAELDRQRAVILAQIEEAETETQRLIRAVAKGSFKDEEIAPAKREIDTRRERLQAALEKLEGHNKGAMTEERIQTILDLAREVREQAEAADFNAARRVIDALNVEVTLKATDDDVAVKITSEVGEETLSLATGKPTTILWSNSPTTATATTPMWTRSTPRSASSSRT